MPPDGAATDPTGMISCRSLSELTGIRSPRPISIYLTQSCYGRRFDETARDTDAVGRSAAVDEVYPMGSANEVSEVSVRPEAMARREIRRQKRIFSISSS
jgi:hypothetical protein